MQFTTLTVAFFAALASAHQHNPQHFHHRRQLNGTAAPSTTLTVFATQIHTVTSCAPTVTNCPARNQASAGVVVTEIIALTTTVCPVAEAEAVSSSIISSAITGGSIVAPSTTAGANSGASLTSAPSVPLSTGVGSGGSGVVSVPVGGGAASSDTTLTYTIGTGSSTTVITTTIRHTSTATVYATQTPGGNNAVAVTPVGGAASSALTTTIQGTSTSTKYVTVVAASSSAAVNGNSGNSVNGNSGAAGSGLASGSCAPVTVTVALSTVTVTATPTGVAGNVAAVTAGNGKGSVSSPTAASDVVIISTASVVPLPISTSGPFNNGTIASATKTPCSSVFPSGFISKSKPSGTGAPIAKFKN